MKMTTKVLFFLVFFIFAIIDSLEAKLNISVDYQTILIIFIGSIPFLISYITNLEITTSGIKVTRTEQEQISNKLEIEENKIKRKVNGSNLYVKKLLDTKSYLEINDRNYALIKARIDIENRLQRISSINKCEECKKYDFLTNLSIIAEKDIISNDIKNIIEKIYPILTERTIKYTEKHAWALEVALKIVNTLNMLIEISLEEEI